MKQGDSRLKKTFAMVSEYGERNQAIFNQSHGTLHVARYDGRDSLKIISIYSICSVVAMVPFIMSAHEAEDVDFQTRFSQCFFVAEKPFLDFLGSTSNLQTYDTRETEDDPLIDEDDDEYDEDGGDDYGGELESEDDE
jgi:hypothetical protein